MANFSKDFPLDAGIFTSGKLTLSGATDADAAKAILANDKFPAGDIELGHVAFTADSGKVGLKPIGGASVSFDIAGSVQGGLGVYGKAADAIKALGWKDAPALEIKDVDGQRYLLMDWGYMAKVSGAVSHPVGMLGSASFGVDTQRNATYAVLQRFGPNDKAHELVESIIASWKLPRHVAFTGGHVNLKAGTWVLAEADGTLGLKLSSSLGWNVTFAKDAKLLGVTHNLSAKIDASLKATVGFSVSGKYIVAVGRADTSQVVRLCLFKQSSKGLDFGFNVTVGVEGADPQLPTNFDDFIKSTFGLHGLQVLKDLREWTDPSTDLGQKLAGLADQTALDVLKKTTGIDPAAEFDKAKTFLGDALEKWDNLPGKLTSMLWNYLDGLAGAPIDREFKTFLGDLIDPAKGADALAKALRKATFGDTPQGRFLEAIADKGLLALADHFPQVSTAAKQALDILNGGTIAKLQKYVNDALDLDQIRKAVSDIDFNKINQWLKDRLANFLDKTVGLDDLKDVQKAVHTLDTKVGDYYKTGVEALKKRYTLELATTYHKTTSGTALIDVEFDLSVGGAAKRFAEVVGGSNLDNLLTQETKGVTLNKATLTHEIHRQGTVDLHMPFFDFSSTHLNDAVATLTAEEQGGRVLIYDAKGEDKVFVQSRMASQLSIMASLKLTAGRPAELGDDGSIAYEMKQVKKDMRAVELKARTTAFIEEYLGGLFSKRDALGNYYRDLDQAIATATQSNGDLLGDLALSMQVAVPVAVLGGWFRPREACQLHADQMQLSRALQKKWRKLLPSLFFQDLNQYQPTPRVAALLVWSSMPISTSIDRVDDVALKLDTDNDVIWNWPDPDLRRDIAGLESTKINLKARLEEIEKQLREAGRAGDADFFDPAGADRFVRDAVQPDGDKRLRSLLFTESRLVRGATGALKDLVGLASSATKGPAQAIRKLCSFAADLTDTFNDQLSSDYLGISGRAVGPMLLVECSAALGSTADDLLAMLALCVLRRGHTFDLKTFLEGRTPASGEIALTQTLASPAKS
jgi:hypothetical protein